MGPLVVAMWAAKRDRLDSGRICDAPRRPTFAATLGASGFTSLERGGCLRLGHGALVREAPIVIDEKNDCLYET